MAVLIDFTKSAKQILIDLLNGTAENAGLGMVAEYVTFGAAVADATTSKNTKIVITPVQGSGYKDAVELFYNRPSIATVPGARSKEFPVGNAVNVSDVIADINARYQLNLTVDDYVEAALPAFEGEPNETQDFTLTMKSTSLLFSGSVVLTLQGSDISLNDAIVNKELDGLEYTQPA